MFYRPILEEQALLKEKLKSQLTWKKDKDSGSLRRKAQPMVRTQIHFKIMNSLSKELTIILTECVCIDAVILYVNRWF